MHKNFERKQTYRNFSNNKKMISPRFGALHPLMKENFRRLLPPCFQQEIFQYAD